MSDKTTEGKVVHLKSELLPILRKYNLLGIGKIVLNLNGDSISDIRMTDWKVE